MHLEVRCLLINEGCKVAEQGDIIRITLVTEEVIIGVLDSAEYDSITINREGQDWTFELEDIQYVSRL